jgi:hypothetical protein
MKNGHDGCRGFWPITQPATQFSPAIVLEGMKPGFRSSYSVALSGANLHLNARSGTYSTSLCAIPQSDAMPLLLRRRCPGWPVTNTPQSAPS